MISLNASLSLAAGNIEETQDNCFELIGVSEYVDA